MTKKQDKKVNKTLILPGFFEDVISKRIIELLNLRIETWPSNGGFQIVAKIDNHKSVGHKKAKTIGYAVWVSKDAPPEILIQTADDMGFGIAKWIKFASPQSRKGRNNLDVSFNLCYRYRD